MSAWVVSTAHIDVLVKGLIETGVIKESEATAVGDDLLEECVRSVSARYGGESRATLPGYRAPARGTYRYREPDVELTNVHYFAAVSCYEYQSCEHQDWESSAAHDRVAELRALVAPSDEDAPDALRIDHSLGHAPDHGPRPLPPDAAPWGFDEEHVHPKVAA